MQLYRLQIVVDQVYCERQLNTKTNSSIADFGQLPSSYIDILHIAKANNISLFSVFGEYPRLGCNIINEYTLCGQSRLVWFSPNLTPTTSNTATITKHLSSMIGGSFASFYIPPKPILLPSNETQLFFPGDILGAEHMHRWLSFLQEDQIKSLCRRYNINRHVLHAAPWYALQLKISSSPLPSTSNAFNEGKRNIHIQADILFLQQVPTQPTVNYNNSLIPAPDNDPILDNGMFHHSLQVIDLPSKVEESTRLIKRTITDSRALLFTVKTTLQPAAYHQCQQESKSKVNITVVETITDHFEVFLHTLQYQLNCGQQATTNWTSVVSLPSFRYTPPSCTYYPAQQEQSKPCYRTMSFTLPDISCQCTVTYSLQGQRNFMTAEMLPPDASYGTHLLPVTVKFGADDHWQYSRSFLLTYPIPDRTMPYNVLTMIGTLFAFFIGSLLNILVRRRKQQQKESSSEDNKVKQD